MIRNQWYAVLDSREVRAGRPVSAKRLNERLVFWRQRDGRICCLKDQCCHRGAALSAGEVHGDHIQCPFHGFQYDKNGKVRVIPANGKNAPVPDRYKVTCYETAEKGGLIWIWWGENVQSLPPVPFFDELEDFKYSQIKDRWNMHYSRCIENQLDVMHLPFVHSNTIGAGHRTLVNGPVVRWDADTMTFYVWNVVDDGKTIPLRPEEIEHPENLFHLQFRFPNIWQNVLSEKARVFAAFAPVDEENSVLYVRFYQRFIKAPVLSHLVNFFANIFDNIVLKQDKRVVATQIPKKSYYKMGEKLVQGDLPIIEYRKRRDQLINYKNELRK